MSISNKQNQSWKLISKNDQDRIVRLAWEDRSSFESIRFQFGLSANEVVKFMRTQLDTKSYKRWRLRATQQGQLKHEKLRPKVVDRFKCSRQRLDGSTKGWK